MSTTATQRRAQGAGVTVDHYAAYVGLTQHRDSVMLHYGREDFADTGKLAREC